MAKTFKFNGRFKNPGVYNVRFGSGNKLYTSISYHDGGLYYDNFAAYKDGAFVNENAKYITVSDADLSFYFLEWLQSNGAFEEKSFGLSVKSEDGTQTMASGTMSVVPEYLSVNVSVLKETFTTHSCDVYYGNLVDNTLQKLEAKPVFDGGRIIYGFSTFPDGQEPPAGLEVQRFNVGETHPIDFAKGVPPVLYAYYGAEKEYTYRILYGKKVLHTFTCKNLLGVRSDTRYPNRVDFIDIDGNEQSYTVNVKGRFRGLQTVKNSQNIDYPYGKMAWENQFKNTDFYVVVDGERHITEICDNAGTKTYGATESVAIEEVSLAASAVGHKELTMIDVNGVSHSIQWDSEYKGKVFVGLSTVAGSTTAEFAVGNAVVLDNPWEENTKLYEVWEDEPTYDYNFYSKDGTGILASVTAPKVVGMDISAASDGTVTVVLTDYHSDKYTVSWQAVIPEGEEFGGLAETANAEKAVYGSGYAWEVDFPTGKNLYEVFAKIPVGKFYKDLIYNGKVVNKVDGKEFRDIIVNGVRYTKFAPKLDIPTNVSVNGTVASWSPVLNATSYGIKVDEIDFGTVVSTSIDLSTIPAWKNLTNGNHVFYVKAIGDGYADSEPAEAQITKSEIIVIENSDGTVSLKVPFEGGTLDGTNIVATETTEDVSLQMGGNAKAVEQSDGSYNITI